MFLQPGLVMGLLLLAASSKTAKAADSLTTAAPRETIALNEQWKFHFTWDVTTHPKEQTVNLPHTWNASDTAVDARHFQRTEGVYTKKLLIKNEWAGKRLFLYFEGVNSVADVFINKHYAGEHKGGYTAFCLEITAWVKPGQDNQLMVQASNAERQDVLPLCGDFNVYGGIHRSVYLLVTDKNCITPLDYASPGVYVVPGKITNREAAFSIQTKLSLAAANAGLAIRTTLYDATHQTIAQQEQPLTIQDSVSLQHFAIRNPHLWNGLQNPYLYSAKIELLQNGKSIDIVEQHFGLRYYTVTADKGFYLNGHYVDLHGVALHEDVAGKGSAVGKGDLDKDMSLVKEIGATALRLAHYPHSSYWYQLCDQNGLVVWSEIPMVGPGGYTGAGYVQNPALEQQARQVLTEMIRQNYNHPSICFWGLFNELKLDYDDPVPFLNSQRALAKQEDSTRLTTCATFLDAANFNGVSDVIAWNKYYGWYGGKPSQIGDWADAMHTRFPDKPIAVSEYGAGASPFRHFADTAVPVEPTGRFHPEEKQTQYHEENWAALKARPFIWGKFIWALADFGSAIRTEGDDNGINDKGLVSYDRSIKKEAFYFYKANWTTEPFVYLTGKRNGVRNGKPVTVKAFANIEQATLTVNGKKIGTRQADDQHILTWEQVPLQKGANDVRVTALVHGKELADSCTWTVQ